MAVICSHEEPSHYNYYQIKRMCLLCQFRSGGQSIMTDRRDASPFVRSEERPVLRWQLFATLAIIVLSITGTILGLLQDGFYKDPYALVYQAYGQDTVTLLLVVPLLTAGLFLARRGSLRGYVLWLGALGYMVYTYAIYSVITQFNQFFLGYVALFGLSLYTLIGGLVRVHPESVKRRLQGELPVRSIVGFLVTMGVLVSLLWLSEVIPATLSNTKPESVAGIGLPVNVVHVLDLGVLLPAVFLSAKWLWQGRPWGYVLPGVLFVKLTTIGLAVLAMIAWMTTEGYVIDPVEIIVFVVLTLANGIFSLKYLLSIQDSPSSGGRN